MGEVDYSDQDLENLGKALAEGSARRKARKAAASNQTQPNQPAQPKNSNLPPFLPRHSSK